MTSSAIPRPQISFSDEPTLVASLIGANRRVLDCGCGSGKIAQILLRGHCSAVGIELNDQRAASAESACQVVVHGSLTDPGTWSKLPPGDFDAVLLSHVLEHVSDPAAVIRACMERLRPGGRLVAVLPNVANWRIRLHLLLGRWEYVDSGILDRTHVRFYTLKTAAQFFQSNGLKIAGIHVPARPPGGGPLRRLAVVLLRRFLPVTLLAVPLVFELHPQAPRAHA